MRYGSIGGLEYEVPQYRLYCLCISVALCSTVLQCICRVIRRSSMTTKAHAYYIIFRRPPIGRGNFPPALPPWRRHCTADCIDVDVTSRDGASSSEAVTTSSTCYRRDCGRSRRRRARRSSGRRRHGRQRQHGTQLLPVQIAGVVDTAASQHNRVRVQLACKRVTARQGRINR